MAVFYASPTGTSGNAGTLGSPWSLAHVATGAGGSVGAGDTVLFLDGTYNINPAAHLAITTGGSLNAPVLWRSLNPYGAVLNGSLSLNGNNFVLHQFRITWLHDTIRTTNNPGSTPVDVPRAQVGANLILGDNVTVAECLINDGGGGLFSSSGSDNFRAIDNIVWNNGWTGPDRGHGHGFYCQNNGTTRHVLRGNIAFCNGSSGIKLGGTSGSLLLRFDVWDNAAFNNQLSGVVVRGFPLESAFQHDGGSNNKGDTTVLRNFFVQQHQPSAFSFEIGDINPGDFPVTITDNVIVGRTLLNEWPSLTFRRNVLTDFPSLSDINVPLGLLRVNNNVAYDIDANTYATRQTDSPFGRALILAATGRNITEWRNLTTYDDNTTFIDGPLPSPRVRVVPSTYTLGKGHIYALNPQGAASVSVDLGPILSGLTGFPYCIYHVYDFVTGGAPTVRGTYRGNLVTLPMEAKTPPQPFGGVPLPQQDNTFGAFVVTADPLRPYTLRLGI